jgi:hypothetical protein
MHHFFSSKLPSAALNLHFLPSEHHFNRILVSFNFASRDEGGGGGGGLVGVDWWRRWIVLDGGEW